ncbi:hypothetical protein JCM10207_007480 [Rhodosporidiobolus poonsookiae]
MSFLPHFPSKECILAFPGVEDVAGWVTINGHPAPVYKEEQGQTQASGTIIAAEDARFAVHWGDLRTAPPAHAFEMSLDVDGVDANGTFTSPADSCFEEPASSSTRVVVYEGMEIGRNAFRPFRFAKLRPTENDDGSSSTEKALKIGTIKLINCRVNAPGDVQDRPAPPPLDAVSVCEQTKPLVPLQTRFDAPETVNDTAHQGYSNFRRIDRKSKPFSSILFRYTTAVRMPSPQSISDWALDVAEYEQPDPPPSLAADALPFRQADSSPSFASSTQQPAQSLTEAVVRPNKEKAEKMKRMAQLQRQKDAIEVLKQEGAEEVEQVKYRVETTVLSGDRGKREVEVLVIDE